MSIKSAPALMLNAFCYIIMYLVVQIIKIDNKQSMYLYVSVSVSAFSLSYPPANKIGSVC